MKPRSPRGHDFRSMLLTAWEPKSGTSKKHPLLPHTPLGVHHFRRSLSSGAASFLYHDKTRLPTVSHLEQTRVAGRMARRFVAIWLLPLPKRSHTSNGA